MIDAIPSATSFHGSSSGLRRIRSADADRDPRGDRGRGGDGDGDGLARRARAGAGTLTRARLLSALQWLNARLPDPELLRFVLGDGDAAAPEIVLVDRSTGRALRTSRLEDLDELRLRLARGCLLVDDRV